MPTYKHIFQVQCESEFPLDMLRYDGMHPRHEPDSYRIRETLVSDGVREWDFIQLEQISGEKKPRYTPARWESFRAKIEHISTEKLP